MTCQPPESMSYKPQAFGFLILTGVLLGRPPVSLIWSLYFSVKQGLDVPTRAAYSHSASVGRRTVTPFFCDKIRQNAMMSAKGTPSTGNFGPLLSDGFLPHHRREDLLRDRDLRHGERLGQNDFVREFVLIAALVKRGRLGETGRPATRCTSSSASIVNPEQNGFQRRAGERLICEQASSPDTSRAAGSYLVIVIHFFPSFSEVFPVRASRSLIARVMNVDGLYG